MLNSFMKDVFISYLDLMNKQEFCLLNKLMIFRLKSVITSFVGPVCIIVYYNHKLCYLSLFI